MAKPTKTPAGTWRVQIKIDGKRHTGTFDTKREVEVWQAQQLAGARNRKTGADVARKTLVDAMERFSEETSDRKKWEWERKRLLAIAAQPTFPGKVLLQDLQPAALGAWRDARLKVNKPGTVLRDISLLSAVFDLATTEWNWLPSSPLQQMRKPPQPRSRQRILTYREIRAQAKALGWRRGPVRSTGHAVAMAMLLALRTGMRAGELCGLQWAQVHAHHAHLAMTKNGHSRDVPLTPKALRLIDRLHGWNADLVLGITTQSLDALFRKARDKAGGEGYTFHDTRHTAATYIAGRLRSGNTAPQQAVLDLCRIFGWTNINQALAYYNPSPADIAARMT